MKYKDFFNDLGRINSMKVRESWVKQHHLDFFNQVEEFTKRNNIISNRFVEKLWYYFNDITETVFCKNDECNNLTSFIGLNSGFLSFCSKRCSNSSADVKNKKIETCLKKYGVDNPYKSAKVIDKIKKTNLERYGVDNPMRSDKIKNEMINRSIQLNGTEWALSTNGKANIKKKENAKEKFNLKYGNLEIVKYSEDKFGVCELKSNECGHTFSINKWQLHQRKSLNIQECTICNPIGSFTETAWQIELEDFLIENKIKYLKNDRSILKNLEIDFYLIDFKVGIELNGLYWHSIKFKDSKYHINKTNKCNELDIQLIHVFEDEWLYKKEIVLSRLLNILNKSHRVIYARNCKVRELTGTESGLFIEENHIQGNIPASKRIGLFYNEELVSVMTFGAMRRALGSSPKDGVYEMYRFCNKLNTSIVGGASKLMKFFIEKNMPGEIISYADRRWSNGNLYLKLGFELIKQTVPNFWYIEGDRRIHRFNYSKKNKIDHLSEFELNRIFDSGSLKFKLTIPYIPDK